MKKVALLLVLALVPMAVMAQEEVPKVEFGVSYELFQVSHANSTAGNIQFDRKASGVSFRGTINVNRWAAGETTVSIQPNLNVTTIGGLPPDFVLGAPGAEFNVWHNEYKFKATARQGDHDQLGIFAFAGPGWVRADPNAILETLVGPGNITKFTFEFGGGFEYYPHRNFGLRLDISDLVIKLGTVSGVPQNRTNNFVLRVGGSFRFK